MYLHANIYLCVYTWSFKRLVCVCLKLLNKVVHDHGEHMYLVHRHISRQSTMCSTEHLISKYSYMNEWMKQSVQVIFNNYFQFRHAKIMGEQLLHIGSIVVKDPEKSVTVVKVWIMQNLSDNVNGFCLNCKRKWIYCSQRIIIIKKGRWYKIDKLIVSENYKE